MAYNTPRTVSTGEVITAARHWNQDVVANTIFLHSPPACRVRQTQDTAISSDVETVLTWNTEVFDNGNLFDAGNNDRLVASVDGLYFMMGSIYWDTMLTLARLSIFHSDGERLFHDTTHPDLSTNQALNTTGYFLMNAGEYIRLFAYQASGTSRTIKGDTISSLYTQAFGMAWVGSGGA